MRGFERIAPPAFGAPMAPCQPSEEARRLLALRRSASADRMTSPGPDAETLAQMLEIAARVPDHRKLTPFRFIIIEGDARDRGGAVLARRFAETTPEADDKRIAIERARFRRAPVVVAVISRIVDDQRTPAFEQTLSAGAVCLNLSLAASAFGYGANWITEWYSYDDGVAAEFGLAAGERFAGFVYIGTATEPPKERQRPVMSDIVARY